MTVQNTVLQLALMVDPVTTADVEFTTSTIGVSTGAKFTPAKLVNIYNRARKALFNAIRKRLPKELYLQELSGFVTRTTTLTFSSGSADLPSGYVEGVAMRDSSNTDIAILSVAELQNVADKESGENRFVFEEGTTFKTLSGDATYVPDAATYKLWYLAISDVTTANVQDSSVVEKFGDEYEPILLELGSAIANGMGSQEVMALAGSLLDAKGIN